MQQQREEEGEGQAHDEEKEQGPNQPPTGLQKRDQLQAPLLLSPSSPNVATAPVDAKPALHAPLHAPPIANNATAATPDQIWTPQAKADAETELDPELEDSDNDDDDDGGAALFGPAALEELPFRPRDDGVEREREREVEGLDAVGDLD
jgi:hypothetical protein